MDSLEERDLNRLRRGKMMLEMAKVRKSPLLTFVFAFFTGFAGGQRFYLGQPKVALAIIAAGVISYAIMFGMADQEWSVIPAMFWHGLLLVELVLAPYTASRTNRKIENELKAKYGVIDA